MKRLYLVRHAKSSWKDKSLNDFDRPLNKRGLRDAPLISTSFKNRNLKPDIIFSSPALRAKKTAKYIAKGIKHKKSIHYCSYLYDTTRIRLERLAQCLKNKNNEALIVGHNPELIIFACNYIDFNENLPTSGIIALEFDCDNWEDINFQNAKLMFFDYPKKNKHPL